MDLENYKKTWENQLEKNTFSKIEIYKLAHSKSSSIVKWIFIIGLLEFIFWFGLNFFIPESIYQKYDDFGLERYLDIISILHYIVIIIFLFLFYKNYRKISTVENTKKLIQRIFKVRKTLKNYVYYNIIIVFLTSLVVNLIIFSDSEKFIKILNPNNNVINSSELITVYAISQIIALFIFLVLLWLFYKLIYGLLLKKLNRNYKKLTTLDKSN